ECAMAYWGLALCVDPVDDDSTKRFLDFLSEAIKRKDTVSPRERAYLEAYERVYFAEQTGAIDAEPFHPGMDRTALAHELELLVLQYPDDLEAKSLLVLARLGDSNRYGQEAIIREILAVAPDHPAAHHFRVHTWDGQEGIAALDSCERYGNIAWQSGHANHMPGHVYSGVGMWHEAAIWMDRATRTEQAYMQQRLALPFETWNYAHNRNYLAFIQEQLGLPTMALAGAREMLAAPLDPQFNSLKDGRTHREGRMALIRGLVKYERWDEILKDDAVEWGASDEDKLTRAYARGLAQLGKGDIHGAIDEQIAFRAIKEGMPAGNDDRKESWKSSANGFMEAEFAAGIAAAQGNPLEAVRLLSEVAPLQAESYRYTNDPPEYPHLLYTVLGDVQLANDAPTLAAAAYRKTLEINLNDAFALSGLARAEFQAGHRAAAQEAYSHLLAVWSDAEPGLRWMIAADALGLKQTPIDSSSRPQRDYRAQVLDTFGPQAWEPYPAPEFDALDSSGAPVTLAEYRGAPVVLVFYLGEGCAHCVEQLQAINKRSADFDSRGVKVLAISSETPEQQAASEKLGGLYCRLLSDTAHSNAKRFRAYDDFEELELHATILIDGAGRVDWLRAGGDPFTDLDFLFQEIDRLKDTDHETEADLAPEDNATTGNAEVKPPRV
ncbi:MAG: peroxiredoxin family protein, partial [bacterium]